MSSLVDYNFLTGVYPSVGKSGYKAEEVNSFHTPMAQSEIEGLLSTHYTVPFSSNNLTAKDLVSRLCYSRLASLDEEERRAIRTELYERIERLKNGEEQMLTSSGTVLQPNVAGTAWTENEDYHPIFTQDDPLMWEVDSSQIRELRDERGQSY